MGGRESKTSASSESEEALRSQVPPEQISTKTEISSQPGAGLKTGQPSPQQPRTVQPASSQIGEGTAEVAEEGGRGADRTAKYGDVPSMAEAADQQHNSYGETPQGEFPSIAEMAEPLVGGGEPVPSAGPSEGTALRSLAEQADVDREMAQQLKHREELESEVSAYSEGQPKPTGGEEIGVQIPSRTNPQQAPGLPQPMAFEEKPITEERPVSEEQAKGGPQPYQRFESSKEPVASSAPSEKELEVGQVAAPACQLPAGIIQGETAERLPPATPPPSPEERQQPQGPRRIGERQRPSGLSQFEARERHEPPEYVLSAPELDRGAFAVGSTQEQPAAEVSGIAGESEQIPRRPGEPQKHISAPELQDIQQRGSAFLGEQQATKLDVEPPSAERREEPVPGISEQQRGQPAQAEAFHAQREGYQGSPRRLQIAERQTQQTAQGQSLLGERNRPEGLQREQLPVQASAELRPTSGEGQPFGREVPSALPPSVQGKAVPMPGVTEFAKMQFPHEGFHEPPKTSLKSEQEAPPGATGFEIEKVIGVGAESGRPVEYEYLPHPADVQFHSWGSTKMKAFENMADCMFNYMANTEKVDIDPQYDFQFDIIGEDDKDLLYKFLDELLFRFNTRKQVICKQVDVNQMGIDQDGSYQLHAVGHGEPYNAEKHGAGTEIKAITLASLDVNEQPERTDTYVIVDI